MEATFDGGQGPEGAVVTWMDGIPFVKALVQLQTRECPGMTAVISYCLHKPKRTKVYVTI